MKSEQLMERIACATQATDYLRPEIGCSTVKAFKTRRNEAWDLLYKREAKRLHTRVVQTTTLLLKVHELQTLRVQGSRGRTVRS